jgi:hypothetical protein
MAAVRLECALGHNAALLISLKNICFRLFHNYRSRMKIASYGFPCEKTTNTGPFYINCEAALGQASSIPDSSQSAKDATARCPGIGSFHYAWCNSSKKEMFAPE